MLFDSKKLYLSDADLIRVRIDESMLPGYEVIRTVDLSLREINQRFASLRHYRILDAHHNDNPVFFDTKGPYIKVRTN